MFPLQLGGTGQVLLFVVLPGIALAAAMALSVYEVYRIGERKLLILLVILALMFQHQALEAWAFLQAGETVGEGFGEVFETGANLIAAGSVYYVLRFARREQRLVSELERSEQQYRNLVEQSPVPILLHGPREIQYANDAAVDMLEADDQSAVTGPSLAAFLPAEESQRVRETVLTDGGTETVESRLQTLDDGTRQVVLAGAPANYEGEEATQIVVQDLTERKQRERELRAERDRRSTLFENNPDPIIEVEFETDRPTITDVNATFEEVFGFDEKSMGGRTVADAIVPESEREAYEEILERTRQGETVETEVRRETEQGVREFILRIMPFEIEEENRAAYVWYTDITERKRRQREFEQIFHGVHDPITIHDLETARVLEVNDAFCDLLGYDREEIIEMGIDGYSAGDSDYTRERAREFVREVVETGEPLLTEWAVETRDGETRWLEVKGTIVEIGGEQRFVAIDRDITERRRREREYEQIFNGVNDAIVIHDPETGEMVDVNDTFCELLGYDRETILELGTAGVSVEEEGFTQERAEEIIDEVTEKGEKGPFEWKVETKDGEHRVLEVRATMAEIGGDPRHVSINRDVTERRRREREYEQIFDNVNDAIAVFDPATGDILDVNQAYYELVGYDSLDRIQELGIEGLSVAAEGYTDQEGRRLLAEVDETGEPRTVEWKVDRKDGEHRWAEVTLAPAEIGGERRVLSIQRDVTERKRRQREYEQIYNGVQDGLQIMDPETLEILDVNDAYLEMFGYDSVEAVREAGVEGISATDEGFTFEEGLEIHQRVVETGEPEILEWKAETTEGEPIWLELKVMPATIDGEERTIVVHRDITERKERQRTLESFHDATGELTTADTVTEAAGLAVEAAADVFDLPATAVYRYDEDTGQLTALATGPDLPAAESLPRLTPDDETAWAAFVEETMRHINPDEASALDAGPGDQVLVLPLGGNGILAVWRSDETFDTDAASILAATLEAALNRLRGERRLESRREELEAQAERARRLEAITELTRRVEAAITTESSRQGIQEAVCAELVDVEPFTAAWVAEAEIGTDRLTPRAVAGIELDDAERIVTDSAGETDPHPGTGAWQTGEPQVMNDLVGSGRRSEWRQTLLRNGAGAVCAVPLAHGGVTHGIITIVAGEPETFGDREVEVLSQLGTSIGYAITAIERQRALESDETRELEFQGSDVDLPIVRLAERLECPVRHERTVRRQDDSVSVYYTLAGKLPESVADPAGDVLPGEVTVVSRQEDRVLLERQGSSWFGSFIAEYGGILRQCRATDDGVTLVVELPMEADTRTMVERVQDEFGDVELTAQRQHHETEATPQEITERLESQLSDRQYEALETAHAMGYFDWPRESSGEEVADALGITQPTVNKHIRLGEHKVFELLFAPESESSS